MCSSSNMGDTPPSRRFLETERRVDARIADETWESFKDVILKEYEDKTLEQVIKYMQDHHDFKATKRQYIHRIGHKWEVNKYNKGKSHKLSEVPEEATVNRESDPGPRPPKRRHNSPGASPFPQSTVPLSVSGGEMSGISSPHLAIRSANESSIDGIWTFHERGAPDQPFVTLESEERLSCPYRKRNPIRFNVRDHQSCALASFPDISQLKRHVRNFHKLRYQEHCPRCKRGFDTKAAVEAHLRVPSHEICELQLPPEGNPEDGFSEDTEDWLVGRKATMKIDNWESLWHLLFPEDKTVPPFEFHPVVEAMELERYLMQHLTNLATILNSELPDIPLDGLRSGLDRSMNTLLKSFHMTVKHEHGTRPVADEPLAPGRREINPADGGYEPFYQEVASGTIQRDIPENIAMNRRMLANNVPQRIKSSSQTDSRDPESLQRQFQTGLGIPNRILVGASYHSPTVADEDGEEGA